MNSNESILLLCFTVLFIIGLLFSFTTFSIYKKTLCLFVFIIIFSYLTYILTYYWDHPNDLNIFTIMNRYFFIYGQFLLIILGVFFICFVFYKIIMGTLIYTLSTSIWFTIGLIVLILALIKETMYKSESDNDYVILIKDIIFYIPCLITDAIDYFKEDYKNTPTTTFIIFIMIIIYCAIFYIIPLFIKPNGHLLITNPEHLNTNILSLSIDQILEIDISQTKEWNHDVSYTDVSYSDISYTSPHYPYDEITKNVMKQLSVKEGFSILQNDTNYYMTKVKPTQDNTQYKPEEIEFDPNQLYNNSVVKNILKGVNHTYSGYEAIRDTLFTNNQFKYKGPYLNNYSLSFWLYINTYHMNTFTKQTDVILTFGSRPSLYYDSINRELIVNMTNNEEEEELLYKSNEILYQRWNYVVMNFNDTVLDLFINNNLVGHYNSKQKNINPQMSVDDLLTIGSIKNNDFGLICNFRYDKPLDLGQIQTNYKRYNKKSPPI
jgi:hypothetical protein